MQTQSEIPPSKLPLATQLARFGFIGASTVSLDFGLLYVLVNGAHVNYFISAFLAFALASTLNYWLSVQYVFVAGRFGKGREFAVFMATTGVGLGLNQFTMWVLVGIAGINYLLAKCASMAIVTCWNFLSKKRIVFLD